MNAMNPLNHIESNILWIALIQISIESYKSYGSEEYFESLESLQSEEYFESY